MSNITISELNSEATALNDNDLLLISKQSADGTTYTSMKMKGSVLKNSGTQCQFTESKVINSCETAIDNKNVATKTNLDAVTTSINNNIANLNNVSKSDISEVIQSSDTSKNVLKLIDRTIFEDSKESTVFANCTTTLNATQYSNKYVNKRATSDDIIELDCDCKLLIYNKSSDVAASLYVYNEYDSTYHIITSIRPQQDIEISFKKNTKIYFKSTNTITYTIIPYWYATDLKYLSNSIVTLNPNSYSYDNYDSELKSGDIVTPIETCVYAGTTLTKDSDYTVTYSDNTLVTPYVSFDVFKKLNITNGINTGKVILTSKESSYYSGSTYATFSQKWRWIGAAIGLYVYHKTTDTTYISGRILWSKTKKESESSNIQYPLTCVATGGNNFTISSSTDTTNIISYGSNYGTKHLKITDAVGTVICDQDFKISDPK